MCLVWEDHRLFIWPGMTYHLDPSVLYNLKQKIRDMNVKIKKI